MTAIMTATREVWLNKMVKQMKPIIEQRCEIKLPPTRIACGFPHKGGALGNKTRVRGQCWSTASSADQHAEIFISPVEFEAKQAAEIVAHELIHAALPHAGHGKDFMAAARKLGYVAPFTQSVITPDFVSWTAPILEKLGPYPHARLNALVQVAAPKKQGTRLLKVECDECGYVARVSSKWLSEVGSPHCPLHGQMAICD